MQAMRLPFLAGALGHRRLDAFVVLVVGGDALEAADRDRLLLALDEMLVLDAAAPAAGSHGLSHVRPRIPGKTLDFQLIMYASE